MFTKSCPLLHLSPDDITVVMKANGRIYSSKTDTGVFSPCIPTLTILTYAINIVLFPYVNDGVSPLCPGSVSQPDTCETEVRTFE